MEKKEVRIRKNLFALRFKLPVTQDELEDREDEQSCSKEFLVSVIGGHPIIARV